MKGLWGSSIAALLVGVSSGAFAADLRAPPAPVAPIYNWNGFYIGFNFGGAITNGHLTDNFTGASFSTNHDMGFIGGGQVGYNWQVSPNFILGVEGTFDGARFDDFAEVVVGNHVVSAEVNTDWIATAAGRIGFTGNLLGNILGFNLTNSTLFYAKGGGAWVQTSATVTELDARIVHPIDTLASFSASNTRSGWVAGAGIEYGVTPNFSVKVEYDHIGLSDFTHNGSFVLNNVVVNDSFTMSRHIDMFTVGGNYRFCWFAGC
jgi:outer membrane immunogenic protein